MTSSKSKSTCAIVALALAVVVTSTNARNCVGNEALTTTTAALLCPDYASDPSVKIKHAWFDPETGKGGHCGGKKTEELQLSIANGLFGGNTAGDRDCSAWCVMNSEGGGHFKFDHKRECFKSRGTGMCGTKKEKDFAKDAKAQTCSPTASPTKSPTASPTASPTVDLSELVDECKSKGCTPGTSCQPGGWNNGCTFYNGVELSMKCCGPESHHCQGAGTFLGDRNWDTNGDGLQDCRKCCGDIVQKLPGFTVDNCKFNCVAVGNVWNGNHGGINGCKHACEWMAAHTE